jgi:serine/threonine-protein kinase
MASHRSTSSGRQRAYQGGRRVSNDNDATPAPGMPAVGHDTEKVVAPPPSPEEAEKTPPHGHTAVRSQSDYRPVENPALTETQDMDPVEVEQPPPDTGGARISFGQAAVNLKLVTPPQIQECVNVQRAMLAKGQRVPLLGQILVKRGFLDREGVEKIKNYQQMYQMADKIPGYKLHAKLGQGAMGIVYKARQVRMERWVAIKILQPELAANPTIKDRFLAESRASARLNHPNVITGIDAGEIGGLCFFAMEYVEGKTLRELVKERGPMDLRQALEITLQLGKALEHAEKHSLVHRDVKPDNAMVTRERQVKLLDLGLAKLRAEGDAGAAKGMAVGTPNYISPEQAMGRQDIDSRSDIYSLGVTLYFILTGRVPFEGPPEVVMYRHIHEPPPHPKNFRPDVTDPVVTLIFNMMAKRPQDRPASAAQLVSDIEHLLRTGSLPGLFQQPAPQGGLKIKKDSRQIVANRRAPKLKGYGMPGNQTPPPSQHPAGGQPPAGQPPQGQPPQGPGGPKMPRKRRKRMGGTGW